jgi:hypothetical protein
MPLLVSSSDQVRDIQRSKRVGMLGFFQISLHTNFKVHPIDKRKYYIIGAVGMKNEAKPNIL